MSRTKKSKETPESLAKATGCEVIVYTNERNQLDFRAVKHAKNFLKWRPFMWSIK